MADSTPSYTLRAELRGHDEDVMSNNIATYESHERYLDADYRAQDAQSSVVNR